MLRLLSLATCASISKRPKGGGQSGRDAPLPGYSAAGLSFAPAAGYSGPAGGQALAILAISPIALWQGWRMARGAWADPAKWDSLGFWSIGLVMATAGAECVAFFFLLPVY
jgi:hypothetical protein